MIFLLIERPADDLMAYQHSKPSNFFTAKGVDKRSGAYAIAEHLDFDLKSSIGAGDTGMDSFLDAVGLSVQVGNHELPFRGYHNTIKLQDSFELGDLLFHIAGLISEQTNENEQAGKARN
jgi:hydroxymethylpyrimidine pyrophosphatase-like HAD family hydrolase